MKSQNIFSDQMRVSRPVSFIPVGIVGIAACREIIGERVEPDVHDMPGVARNRYAPGEGRPTYAQVAQAFPQERSYLVPPVIGLYEPGVLLDVLKNGRAVFGELEKIARLFELLNRPAAVRELQVYQLFFGPETLAVGAVPVLVFSEIDVAAFKGSFPEPLDSLPVPLLCSPYEVVVGYLELLPEVFEPLADLCREIDRGEAGGRRGLLDLLSVLVGACQEEYVEALEPLETRYRVRRYRRICVPYVRHVVDVVYGCGYVVGLLILRHSPLSLPASLPLGSFWCLWFFPPRVRACGVRQARTRKARTREA